MFCVFFLFSDIWSKELVFGVPFVFKLLEFFWTEWTSVSSVWSKELISSAPGFLQRLAIYFYKVAVESEYEVRFYLLPLLHRPV
uniref:Uncharacterized protein n=1 Tax=Rhizophora mucronata TaxID=61149 RepID=A0A2P2MB14_RHIMU